jgi:phosphoribosylamine---glycine ligase
VATVSIGKSGAKNAAILAAQILAVSDAELAERLAAFKQEMAEEVEKKARAVEKASV